MAPVSLNAATAADAPVLANLLELYCHELSDIFQLEVGADGRFGYPRLPLYWTEPDTRFAFLIYSGSSIAGFALATRGSPATTDPRDLDVAEFFILRLHRRSGLGMQAAHLLWNQIPGRWVVRVAEANKSGTAFWERTIASYAGDKFSTLRYTENGRPFRALSFISAGVR
jgi:predicted acetyltransferase